MPLHLAHHKSYHPYNRDNIERVKRDEEDARNKEAAHERQLASRDRADRLAALRRQRDERLGVVHEDVLPAWESHPNFWADMEDGAAKADQRGHLGGQAVELKPWYAEADLRSGREQSQSDAEREKQRRRDESAKHREDPMGAVPRREAPARAEAKPATLSEERARREAREAERAAALLARKGAFFRAGARAQSAARGERRRPRRRPLSEAEIPP